MAREGDVPGNGIPAEDVLQARPFVEMVPEFRAKSHIRISRWRLPPLKTSWETISSPRLDSISKRLPTGFLVNINFEPHQYEIAFPRKTSSTHAHSLKWYLCWCHGLGESKSPAHTTVRAPAHTTVGVKTPVQNSNSNDEPSFTQAELG